MTLARPAALDWPEMAWLAVMGETDRAAWLANHGRRWAPTRRSSRAMRGASARTPSTQPIGAAQRRGGPYIRQRCHRNREVLLTDTYASLAFLDEATALATSRSVWASSGRGSVTSTGGCAVSACGRSRNDGAARRGVAAATRGHGRGAVVGAVVLAAHDESVRRRPTVVGAWFAGRAPAGVGSCLRLVTPPTGLAAVGPRSRSSPDSWLGGVLATARLPRPRESPRASRAPVSVAARSIVAGAWWPEGIDRRYSILSDAYQRVQHERLPVRRMRIPV